MKILVVGVFDVYSSNDIFMAKGFDKLEHDVDRYSYREKIREFGSVLGMNEDLKKYITNSNAELIVFCKTDTVFPDVIQLATKKTNTWYWFMDPLKTAKSFHSIFLAQHTTYASATSNEVVNYFNTRRKNACKIIQGVDSCVFKKTTEDKIYPVSFIGNHTPKRASVISYLAENTKHKIHVFGAGWNQQAGSAIYHDPVFTGEFAKVVNQSHISLNICQSNIYSIRVVYILASGGFLLTENVPDIQEEFTNYEHLVTYQDNNDLVAKVDELLTKKEQLEQIAKNGNEYVSNMYTWEKVCNRILDKVI